MKTIGCLTCIVVLACVIGYLGCSKSNRDEAIQRVEKAAKALNGGELQDSEEHAVPTIVAEQQRKERIRQNTKWTTENQALHPIEYCQAQLEELDRHAKKLEVTMHEVAVNQSKVKREIGENEAMAKQLATFLAESKAAYKASETNGRDTVALGGFTLTKEKAKEKIVEAARKVPRLQSQIGTLKNFLVKLEKKANTISNAQKKIVENRDLIQKTISNLKLKQVIDGEQGIRDALNAINDNMASLGEDYDSPALDEIIQPSNSAAVDDEFKKLMAE